MGIFLPAQHDTYLYFVRDRVTADCLVDVLEHVWPELDTRFQPHTLVLNLDNGPENHSHRTQFIKRLVAFAGKYGVTLRLLSPLSQQV